ncbi:MAG: hypothetical protein JXR97_10195 [Planctomycetes bacterium]|nr:hypothetical protein [Planctomycetota bacterium]
MNVKYQLDASGRRVVEVHDLSASRYQEFRDAIVRQFDLQVAGELVQGMDEAFQDFSHNEAILGIEWDIWSGFIVVARNDQAEELLESIGRFLEHCLHDSDGKRD